MFGEIVWFMNGIKRSSSTSTNSSADTPVSDSSDRSLELEVEELASPALPQFFPHFGNWNINESQTPTFAPRLVTTSVSCGEVWGNNFGILLNFEVFAYSFSIFDIYREFFLLLCWRNARCSYFTIMLKIMPA